MHRPRKLIVWLNGVSITGVLTLVCYVWWPLAKGPNGTADYVLVLKAQHRMILFRNGQEICAYHVSVGRGASGPKQRQGDHRTPEGKYVLDHKNPKSGFHRAIHLSYPNALDRSRAAREGVAPGGDIMVHGIKNGFGWVGRLHRLVDWTDGCIALTNAEMDQFWDLLPEGTPIEIRHE